LIISKKVDISTSIRILQTSHADITVIHRRDITSSSANRYLRIGPDSVLHASHVERRLADRSNRRTTVVKNANNGHARRVISDLSTAIGLRRLNLQNSGTYTHLSAQVATVVTRPTTTPDTAASSDSASGASGLESTGLRDRDITVGDTEKVVLAPPVRTNGEPRP
jgi:hypothetical protein